MNARERNSLRSVAAILLVASSVRLAWESRPLPPVFEADSTTVLPELLAASESLAAESALRSRRLLPGETLDINEADEIQWDRLPGVGAVTADRIMETRERLGGFGTIDDLQTVPGIGPRTLEDLRPFLETPTGGGRGAPGRGRGSMGIDLNRAGVEELASLPGIGPTLAARIIEVREAEGPFRSVEDVLRVSGIGPALLAGIQGLVHVGDPH